MTQYRMGICEICGKYNALKDNICCDCKERHQTELPDCFKEIFSAFKPRKEENDS